MPSSTATIQRDDLVKRALRRVGIDYPNANQIGLAVPLLNDIVKEIDSEGRWLYAINPYPSSFQTVNGQRSYPVGGKYQFAKFGHTSTPNIDFSTGFNPDWNAPFSFTFRVRFPANINGTIEFQNLAGSRGFTFGIDSTGTTHTLAFGNDGTHFVSVTFDDATLLGSGWRRFVVTYDGTGLAAGFQIYCDATAYALTVVAGGDTLGGRTTVSSNPIVLFGQDSDASQLGIFMGVALTTAQVTEIQSLGDRGPLSTLTFADLLTHYWPLNGSSAASIGGITGGDNVITYPIDQGNGIAKDMLKLEWAEVVLGTSLRPLRIIYSAEALNNIQREATNGEPYFAFLEPAASMLEQRLHLFPTPSAVRQINYTYQRRLYDFSNATDNPDFPQDWATRLVKRLSAELAPEFGLPLEERQQLRQDADAAMHDGKTANVEKATAFPRRSQYY